MLPADRVGTLAVAVTPETADTTGNPVAEETLHAAPFEIVAVPVVVVPPPPPVDDPPPSEPSDPPDSGTPPPEDDPPPSRPPDQHPGFN